MLNHLTKSLKLLRRTSVAVDPSQFEDPVATSTKWTPLTQGGANFCTHKLVEITPHRIGFLTTLGLKLSLLVCIIAGIAAMGFGVHQLITAGETAVVIFLLIFGIVFAVIGTVMFCRFGKPSVFDKITGLFYKGRKAPKHELLGQSRPNAEDKAVQLHKIHALQLISEFCRSSKHSYYSYELNLVLDDGERINVIDHADHSRIRQDANTLSNFLGKPLWDAT